MNARHWPRSEKKPPRVGAKLVYNRLSHFMIKVILISVVLSAVALGSSSGATTNQQQAGGAAPRERERQGANANENIPKLSLPSAKQQQLANSSESVIHTQTSKPDHTRNVTLLASSTPASEPAHTTGRQDGDELATLASSTMASGVKIGAEPLGAGPASNTPADPEAGQRRPSGDWSPRAAETSADRRPAGGAAIKRTQDNRQGAGAERDPIDQLPTSQSVSFAHPDGASSGQQPARQQVSGLRNITVSLLPAESVPSVRRAPIGGTWWWLTCEKCIIV